MGAGGRTADRESLGEALEGLLALLDPDNEFGQGVRHAGDVYGNSRYVFDPELAQG
jgi:hypothetical protein